MVVRGIPVVTNLPGKKLVPTLCPGGGFRPCARDLVPRPTEAKLTSWPKLHKVVVFTRDSMNRCSELSFCMKIRSPAVVRTMVFTSNYQHMAHNSM